MHCHRRAANCLGITVRRLCRHSRHGARQHICALEGLRSMVNRLRAAAHGCWCAGCSTGSCPAAIGMQWGSECWGRRRLLTAGSRPLVRQTAAAQNQADLPLAGPGLPCASGTTQAELLLRCRASSMDCRMAGASRSQGLPAACALMRDRAADDMVHHKQHLCRHLMPGRPGC